MVDPPISVLLPTYEPDPVFLRETLDALLAQTHAAWTCGIRDDASSCDTEEIVRPYLRDPRIRFVRNEKRLGIGGNWNACLRDADGDFVQFLFQDDRWDPHYVEKASAILASNPGLGFVAVEHAYECEEGIETARGYEPLRDEKRRVLRPGVQDGRAFLRAWLERGLEPNLIGEPCFVMLRKSVTDSVGVFDTELVQLLDVEYWVRMLRVSDWYYLSEELGTFRVHRKAASFHNSTLDIAFKDHCRCLEKIAPLFVPGSPERASITRHLDRRFADVVGHIVNRLIRWQTIGKGSGPFLRYFREHPRVAVKALVQYAGRAIGRWCRKAFIR